jgi:hypothetical protein
VVGEVTTLAHEVRDNPVEGRSLDSLPSKAAEVL